MFLVFGLGAFTNYEDWNHQVTSKEYGGSTPIEFTKPSKMNQNHQAKKQFELVIKADLNRWWEESDLDAQDMAEVMLKAVEDWLDEEIIGFEPDEG